VGCSKSSLVFGAQIDTHKEVSGLGAMLFKRFVEWNKSICDRIEMMLPGEFTRSLLYLHERTVVAAMTGRRSQTVVDIGGGHFSPFAKHRDPKLGTRLVAIDILVEQIKKNTFADFGVVADVGQSIPLKDGSVDIIVTRSVLEHLEDNRDFFSECLRVLKDGGTCFHVFPCRFALFALINQIIPNAVANKLLFSLFPEWRERCGFRAYYHNCYSRSMIKRQLSAGLSIKEVYYRYYQAIYFKFFIPFYLLVTFYDLILYYMNLRPLAAQMFLIVAKPEGLPVAAPTAEG